jgi:hypothetical protein
MTTWRVEIEVELGHGTLERLLSVLRIHAPEYTRVEIPAVPGSWNMAGS